eukprot:gene12150-25499_t
MNISNLSRAYWQMSCDECCIMSITKGKKLTSTSTNFTKDLINNDNNAKDSTVSNSNVTGFLINDSKKFNHYDAKFPHQNTTCPFCNRGSLLFKLENFQQSGSFKDRGIGHMIYSLHRKGDMKKIICSSGGNAGHAVATVGEQLSIPVDVYVPTTTKAMMIDKLHKRGAKVFIQGENWNVADTFARKAVAEEKGAYYIPPYDDPLIWEGNASLVDELQQANIKPDCIVLSVGGGGLLCGVQKGLERLGWLDTRIIAVETDGAASFAAAKAAGKPVSIGKITTVASSLGALSVTSATLQSPIRTESLVVTDVDAISAAIRFANERLMLVEPACGAALSAVYSDKHWESITSGGETVVVVVCGGSVVNLDLLLQWKNEFSL